MKKISQKLDISLQLRTYICTFDEKDFAKIGHFIRATYIRTYIEEMDETVHLSKYFFRKKRFSLFKNQTEACVDM